YRGHGPSHVRPAPRWARDRATRRPGPAGRSRPGRRRWSAWQVWRRRWLWTRRQSPGRRIRVVERTSPTLDSPGFPVLEEAGPECPGREPPRCPPPLPPAPVTRNQRIRTRKPHTMLHEELRQLAAPISASVRRTFATIWPP